MRTNSKIGVGDTEEAETELVTAGIRIALEVEIEREGNEDKEDDAEAARGDE